MKKMSSDSSDEENLEFLKEAQDNQFINDSMFSEKPGKSVTEDLNSQERKSLPSQRIVDDADAQFNFLKVTPQFRDYVAKRLSEILDAKLNKQLGNVEVEEVPRKKRIKGGIKLLSESKHFLKPSKNVNNTDGTVIESVNINRVPRYNKLKVEVSEESLKEVAVSPEYILSKKEVESWSKRSKAPVYRYKKTKSGQLVLVE